MEISRRSWHIRLHQWMCSDGVTYTPGNLCVHFWLTIMLLIFLAISAVILAATSPVWGIYLLFVKGHGRWLENHTRQ